MSRVIENKIKNDLRTASGRVDVAAALAEEHSIMTQEQRAELKAMAFKLAAMEQSLSGYYPVMDAAYGKPDGYHK